MKKKVIAKRLVALLCTFALLVTCAPLMPGNKVTAKAAIAYEAVYRLYNPNTGEHFYTTDTNEYEFLQGVGWNDEGIGWYTALSGDPVYRVYNPNAKGGDHYYTMSYGEAEYLVSLGWEWDNDAKPVFYSAGSANLYVAYNPNASSGAHNYTTSLAEQDMLLSIGWLYGEVAWQVVDPDVDGDPQAEPEYIDRVKVDENITGVGGEAKSNDGSYRWQYSNKKFDAADLSKETPEIEFSADVTISGSKDIYEFQFIVAGTGPKDGQIGVSLRYMGGNDSRYNQGKICCQTVNFPANSGIYGNQFYSVNTKAPSVSDNEKVSMTVKYYASGYVQTYVKGYMIGQYKTALNPTAGKDLKTTDYILHFFADDTASCKVENIKVYKKGSDVTNRDIGLGGTSFNVAAGGIVQGIY